jgi:hypothetical protein
MRGDRPDIVERFFGKGRYDVNEALGPKAVELQGPVRPGLPRPAATPAGASRLPAMQGVAEDLGVETFIKNRMTPGAQARAAELLQPPTNVLAEIGRSVPFGFGGFIERPAALFQEKVINPRVTRSLERGFATPQGAAALLDFMPAGQRGIDVLEGLSPEMLRVLQQFGVEIGREPSSNVNSMRR